MYGYPVSRVFSLGKILTGLSKTLSLANNILPIYNKAKPVVSNARSIISAFKNINLNDTTKPASSQIKIKKEIINKSTNNPQFFI